MYTAGAAGQGGRGIGSGGGEMRTGGRVKMLQRRAHTPTETQLKTLSFPSLAKEKTALQFSQEGDNTERI
jgi:hypothetical protein